MITPMPTQLADGAAMASQRRVFNWSQCRTGKEQPVDAFVATPWGFKTIGSLRGGDIVSHPNGGTSRVIGVFPQGLKQAYRLTFRDGSETECGIDHLWPVLDKSKPRDRPPVLMTLRQILEHPLRKKDNKFRFTLPTTSPVPMAEQKHLIPPYTMGALLGDGSLGNGQTFLSVADRDTDILDRVRELSPDWEIVSRRTGRACTQARISYGPNKAHNLVSREIRMMSADTRSDARFIPAQYLTDSLNNRVELLRGLMDTDGSCGLAGDISKTGIVRKSPSTSFSTKSLLLAWGVADLVRSLGGVASVKHCLRGQEVEYTVRVQTSFCPFRTAFKRARWAPVLDAKGRLLRSLVSVEPTRTVEQVCISVSAPDGLYLTNNYIPTHNTWTAVIGADIMGAQTILVVTTASGRGVWRRAFNDLSDIKRRVRVLDSDPQGETDVGIISWGSLKKLPRAIRKRPDLILLDEDHKACNPTAQRTQVVYGVPDGDKLLVNQAIVQSGDTVWHMSGTPLPHDLGNGWARMRASFPERLASNAARGWPDVTDYDVFRDRYCKIGYKKLPDQSRIPVVLDGKNMAEMRDRIEYPTKIYVRRTQQEVGIRAPQYELLPLISKKAVNALSVAPAIRDKILNAAWRGETEQLAKELGTLRRHTGMLKAELVIGALKDEFEGGLDKVVLGYWHREVGDLLEEKLAEFGVLRLSGATSARDREGIERRFHDKANRIALIQIEAGCEAIDLSPANELWGVEYATSPRQMDQLSKRITNVSQTRPCFVRACCIEGSIDEMIQKRLVTLWNSIREVVQ